VITVLTILFALLATSVPIAVALGLATLAFIVFFDPLLMPTSAFRAFFGFLDKYTLMAIPFFILAGFLMDKTGLVRQLFRFADALVGWFPGGFGFATIVACVIFGAISGSSTAMAAAMSVIAYPELLQRGYPRWLACGIIASGGGIAILIPPSIVLILYGIVTETSVTQLFFAGIIPGLLLAVSDAIVIAVFAWWTRAPWGRFNGRILALETLRALPALAMPVFVLGGLYGGFFTPTEAGAAAVGYVLIYGVLTERMKFVGQLLPVTRQSLNLTAIVFLLTGCVGMFQFLLANQGWPMHMAQAVVAMDLTPSLFLMVLFPILVLLGMLLTAVALVLLTVPVIFPIAWQLGIDPIVLGILFTLVAELAVITPPVGMNLFAVSGTTRVPLPEVIKGASPFLLTDGLVVVLVFLFPALATWLPYTFITPVFR
jgi:C4-dicarboxylate transporter, DctM subunit